MAKENKEEFIYICTRCGSTNVRSDLSKDMIAWGGSTRWVCGNCGFSAIVFPEVKKSEIENFRRKLKERPIIKDDEHKKYSKSKGFTNKTVNNIFLIYNVILIIASIIFVISVGFDEENYPLVIVSIIFLFLLGFFGYNITRTPKKDISKNKKGK